MALYKNLLGHNLEKFGAVTVFDATFYDVVTNKPLITFDTLTVSNISFEAEQKEIRGGQGANLLLTYDYGKTATVEITDALASMYSLQYLTGGKLKGDFDAMIRREINTDNDWKVPHEAADSAAIVLWVKDGGEQVLDESAVIQPSRVVEGHSGYDRGFVYYKAKFNNATENEVKKSHVLELTVTAKDFPPMVKLIGDTVFIDSSTGKPIEAQVEIPRFKLAADFELTFEAEGDASVFDFNGTALAHNDQIMIVRTLGYLDGVTDNVTKDEDGENPEDGKAVEQFRVTLIYEAESEMKIDTIFVDKKASNGIGSILATAPYDDYSWTVGLEGEAYENGDIEENITLVGTSN